MDVVVVSSEVAPFSKSGGLGDVCGAIPRALVRRGHRVITVSPRYASVDLEKHGAVDTGVVVGVHAAAFRHDVRFYRVDADGVVHLLVDHGMFHRDGLYGDKGGTFRDNHIRFAVLSRAAIEAARRVPLDDGGPLGEDVVFHANDWHAALVPVYLEALYRPLGLFPYAPSVLTIHNLAHQGHLPGAMFDDLELSPRWNRPDGLEWYGDINLLKGGMLAADAITTVSPTFAREIATPAGGFGLDGVIRHRHTDLIGILNGIDPDEWNPATDAFLDATYDADTLEEGKPACKAALQRELGLPEAPDVPLVGAVGRLDPQKGVELLVESVPWLVSQGAQVVVLGSAAPAHAHYEAALRELERRHPRHVRAWIGFSERVAHRIEAGADLFVMPSRFEPSGLNQLYSMRYGTVPVVRATGGLADSVQEADLAADRGTGFTFRRFHGEALRDALYRALSAYRADREGFLRLARRGMARDDSWEAVVGRYEAVYRALLARRTPA